MADLGTNSWSPRCSSCGKVRSTQIPTLYDSSKQPMFKTSENESPWVFFSDQGILLCGECNSEEATCPSCGGRLGKRVERDEKRGGTVLGETIWICRSCGEWFDEDDLMLPLRSVMDAP